MHAGARRWLSGADSHREILARISARLANGRRLGSQRPASHPARRVSCEAARVSTCIGRRRTDPEWREPARPAADAVGRAGPLSRSHDTPGLPRRSVGRRPHPTPSTGARRRRLSAHATQPRRRAAPRACAADRRASRSARTSGTSSTRSRAADPARCRPHGRRPIERDRRDRSRLNRPLGRRAPSGRSTCARRRRPCRGRRHDRSESDASRGAGRPPARFRLARCGAVRCRR